MKCSIKGCPGEYEEKGTVHTVCRGAEIFVFNHVPAVVCLVCGDTIPPGPRRCDTSRRCYRGI
jgi:YgiT-type zinc finger domain-containing protein